MTTSINLSDLSGVLPSAVATSPPAPADQRERRTISCAIRRESDKTIFEFTVPNHDEGMRIEMPALLDAQQCAQVVDCFIRQCVSGPDTVMYDTPE